LKVKIAITHPITNHFINLLLVHIVCNAQRYFHIVPGQLLAHNGRMYKVTHTPGIPTHRPPGERYEVEVLHMHNIPSHKRLVLLEKRFLRK
jgi:hypothetical protein